MELHETVIATVAETLGVPRTEVRDESKLVDLAKDSIKLFELLIQLEEMFNHRVTYEEIAHIETVGDMIAYIKTLPTDVVAAVNPKLV